MVIDEKEDCNGNELDALRSLYAGQVVVVVIVVVVVRRRVLGITTVGHPLSLRYLFGST